MKELKNGGINPFHEKPKHLSGKDQGSGLTRQEKKDLENADEDMPGDDEELRRAALDSTDEEGTPLNEGSFDADVTADDLDVPGTSQDDKDEEIGEEDEENNEYSLGNQDEDDEENND